MAASLSSDMYHEFACTPCADGDINKEAVVYCVNCIRYFCKSCLRVHNSLPDLGEHQLLDKDEFRHFSTTVNKGRTPDLPTEKCQTHHGKLFDMYCEDHDMISCSACVAFDHRQCKHLHYIPDIASSRLSQLTIQTVSKNLSDHLDEFNILKQNRKQDKTRLANEKDSCLSSIKERRRAINEYLDREEKILIDRVTIKYAQVNAKLDNDIKTCDESINLLGTMKGKLNTSSYNASQTFIDLKRAEHAMKETGVQLGNCKGNRNNQYTIIYEEGPAVKEILSPYTIFGNVILRYETPNALKKVEDINVRFNSDKSVSDCRGLCQLPDGTIIITDWNNKNLKSLEYDDTYKQSDSLSMSNSPSSVCTVNDNEVAVTVTNDKKVSIVSVSPKMAVKSSFYVDSRCLGIAYSDGYLYVGHFYDSKLTVYDLQGKYLKTFSTDSNGKAICIAPLHFCVIPKTQHIVVADKDKGIVITDKSGNLVAEYTYTNQGYTRGVCIDDRGNVYITDFASKQLVVLDKDGTVTTLLDNLTGSPRAVLFDKHRQRLLVTIQTKNDIQSFSLLYNHTPVTEKSSLLRVLRLFMNPISPFTTT